MNKCFIFILFLPIYFPAICQSRLDTTTRSIHVKKIVHPKIDTNIIDTSIYINKFIYLGQVTSPGVDSGKTLYTTTDRLKLIGSNDSSLVITSFEMIIGFGRSNGEAYSNDGRFNNTLWLDLDMACAGSYIYIQRIYYKDNNGKLKALKPLKLIR